MSDKKIPYLAIKRRIGGLGQTGVINLHRHLAPRVPETAKHPVKETIWFFEGKIGEKPYFLEHELKAKTDLRQRVCVGTAEDVFGYVSRKRRIDTEKSIAAWLKQMHEKSIEPPIDLESQRQIVWVGSDKFLVAIEQLLLEATPMRTTFKAHLSRQQATERPIDVKVNIQRHLDIVANMVRRQPMPSLRCGGVESVLHGESAYAFEVSDHLPTQRWDIKYAFIFFLGANLSRYLQTKRLEDVLPKLSLLPPLHSHH